jgi:hypothetical protein
VKRADKAESEIPKDEADKFTWVHGDIQFVSHGEGPTLAEIARQQEEADRAAEEAA